MKKSIITLLIACLATVGLASPAWAEFGRIEMATMDEARAVAENWITLIIHKTGGWGGSERAEVERIQEFKRGERVLGYFCSVKPHGFIVVSLYKALAPVKAYSETSDLEPDLDEGMADLIKDGMERVLDWIEQLLGPIESAQAEDLDSILEINYHQAWEVLENDVEVFERDLESGRLEMNYQEGEILLTSNWHQEDPYNQQCPAPPPGDDCTEARCWVGCAATAGAQVMRYWNWPPYRDPADPYDWPNMPDALTSSSPQVQIDAVARLCHEVGVEAGMDYCGGTKCESAAYFSSHWGKDLLDAFEDHFWYSDAADDADRNDYGAVEWFNRIKAQLNLNRPIPYTVTGHGPVCDGWRESGSPVIREYHMNYGWADSHSTWYILDALHLGDPDEEVMIENLFPAHALGSSLSGTYGRPSLPYRYFDQDATGNSAIFESGQNLQFLHNITVTCTGSPGDSIRFEGSISDITWLFSRGDRSQGVRIYNGAIQLYRGGSIRFH